MNAPKLLDFKQYVILNEGPHMVLPLFYAILHEILPTVRPADLVEIFQRRHEDWFSRAKQLAHKHMTEDVALRHQIKKDEIEYGELVRKI